MQEEPVLQEDELRSTSPLNMLAFEHNGFISDSSHGKVVLVRSPSVNLNNGIEILIHAQYKDPFFLLRHQEPLSLQHIVCEQFD